MADDPSSKNDVLKVKIDSSKSSKDVEKEIAAVASAIGEAKTVAGKAILKEQAKPLSADKEKIPISINEKNNTKSNSSKDAPKIKQASSSIMESDDKSLETDTEKQEIILSRHGKDLKPINPTNDAKKSDISSISSEKIKVSVKPVKKADIEKTKSIDIERLGDMSKTLPKNKVITKTPIKTAKPYPVIEEVVRKDEKPKKTTKPNKGKQADNKELLVSEEKNLKNKPAPREQSPKSKQDEDKPQKGTTRNKPAKHTPHVTRLYDTKTYHIPLSVDRHNRKSAMPRSVQISIVLFAIIVMATAVVISSGFNL